MNDIENKLKALLECVTETSPEEIDCDAFLDRVGTLVERVRMGVDPEETMQVVAQHAKVCPECREELEALLALHTQKPDDQLGPPIS